MARALRIVDHNGRPITMSSADYEGAMTGRRMGSWGLQSSGPNTTLFSSLGNLRARSRELVRNDPQIDGGLDTLVSNLVGSGITPRWQISDPDVKAAIQQLWNDWVHDSDADGLLDFYGQQALVARSVIESGEIFVRFRPRYMNDPYPVPLQLQLLESDHVDSTYNTVAPNGNEIRMGIEFNKIGQRTAYWMFQDHPGEQFITQQNYGERKRIPASQVLHVFKPLRPGQQRGRPWASSIIALAHEVNDYDDAEVVRKKSAAMFGGFITKPPEDEDAPSPIGKYASDDSEGNTVVALEPGTFPELPPGYEVNFSQPADVGGNYETFVKRQDRRVARGFGGLTYEKLTGDLADINYSSIRAGNLEFQRQCKQFIFNVLAHQLCRPVSKYWLNQAFLASALDLPDYLKTPRKYWNIKWTIDGWPWVDPEKELKGSKGLVRAGFSSRSKEVGERGEDAEEIDRENQADNQRADNLGLVYDSDGRKTDAAGKEKEGDSSNAEPE